MRSFEDRYRAIVEARPELACGSMEFDETVNRWYDDAAEVHMDIDIARAAVCWWLERAAIKHLGGPQEYWKFIVDLIGWGCYEADPQGAVVSVWEIILRKKRRYDHTP